MSIIESIIEGKTAEKIAAQKEQQAKKSEAVDKLFQEMKARLGEFWDVLEERREKTGEPFNFSVSWDGDLPTLRLDLPALDEHRLAPIFIKWDRHSNHPSYTTYKAFGVMGYWFSDISEALFYARKHYDEYKAKEREKKIDEFEQAINWNYSPRDMTEEQAREIVEKHLAELPDREEEALRALAYWVKKQKDFIERQENERRALEENESKRALLQTIKVAYIADLARWMEETDSILARNQAIAKSIQMVSDCRKYEVFKLTYALVVDYSEDGETSREIETRSVYTLQEEPDESGYWRVDGKSEPIKFYNLVSIEKREVKASIGILSKRIERGGVELHFAPDVLDERIPEIVSEIQGLPQEPKAPEELGENVYYYKSDYLRSARELIASQGKSGEAWEDQQDGVPF